MWCVVLLYAGMRSVRDPCAIGCVCAIFRFAPARFSDSGSTFRQFSAEPSKQMCRRHLSWPQACGL